MASYAHAQVESNLPAPGPQGRKGQVYVYWGYNRAYYNKSDVHYKGEHYDFTLHNARAEDMPEKFDPSVYFNLTQLTIPQFNFRAGYYLGRNTSISAGWDHMKYHLIPTQLVRISGRIDEEYYPIEGYSGNFDNEYILYKPLFMDYHHSDGFNYIRIGLEQRLPFWSSRNGKLTAAFFGGVSGGALMPWTDFTFFGERHRNKPHFAGYGVSMNSGFRLEFLNWFFIQMNAQAGWANLPDIMLEDELPSRASQKISFFERSWAVGGYIPLVKSK
jgi:hypothetical protein